MLLRPGAISSPAGAKTAASTTTAASSPGDTTGATGATGAAVVRASAAPARAATRVIEGKSWGSGRSTGPTAALVRAERQDTPRLDTKSLAARPARAEASVRAEPSPRVAPADLPSQARSPSSRDNYDQAVRTLNAFFERERAQFPAGAVESIEHFFSHGEWGIAHSVIAEFIKSRAASPEGGVSPALLNAATCVLNHFG